MVKSLLNLISLFLVCTFPLFAQSVGHADDKNCQHAAHQADKSQQLRFIENHNQWDPAINYAIELGGLNYLYLEDRSFTYLFHDPETAGELHDVIRETDEVRERHRVKGHAYRVHFVGAQTATLAGKNRRPAYNNYLIGNDPGKWASEVPVYREVSYGELYPGIDLVTYGEGGNFKYDFIVVPNGNPDQIELEYEGVDSIYLQAGDLVIKTSVNTIIELAPYAYQVVNDTKVKVECHYVLNGQTLTFSLPDGYDETLPLVIDPTVIGATLSGTVVNENFGHSASFDNEGNIYTAAISFGQGYPATTGAFQLNYAGGSTDIAVNKYNENGTDLIYATYIGGDAQEYPHSTIVDYNGQLCIFGSTASADYPTTTTAIQTTFGGIFDIIVTKLNEDGTALIGSTYLGGSDADGFNFNTANQGDNFRGEIVLDPQGNIYIASCSRSANLPTTANSFQPTISPGAFNQDGIVAKLNSDLSTAFWTTFLGGSGDDIAMGLRVAESGSVYVTGIASGSNFPMVPGGIQPAFSTGPESAFIVRLSANGSAMTASTFWGTNDRTRGYFIDLDETEQVHIYGQTTGDIPITPGTYSFNPGSRQFLTAFTSNLDELVYSTVIGTGGFFSDFIPVAFMVDKCNNIYFSGYETSNGLPLSPDAFYTIGQSFYLGVLEPNAVDLSFGTYYGEANHVDGGTSRFDKGGIVYQGVCSCNRANSPSRVLNTTPGAWATNQTVGCDVGVFKIDFEVATVTAQARTEPATSGCAPFATSFTYTGQDAETIFWDFGNGQTSTDFNPSTTFEEPGTYTITQIVNASNTCNLSDTFRLSIDVLAGDSNLETVSICPGEEDVFLDVSTINATYNWSDGSAGPTLQTDEPGTYWVDISLVGCTRRDSFIVSPPDLNGFDLGEDQAFCDESSFTLDATNSVFVDYEWQDGSTDPIFIAQTTGTYSIELTTIDGCTVNDNVFIRLDTTPFLELGPDLIACEGEVVTLSVNDPNLTQVWQDGSASSTYSVTMNGVYSVTVDPDRCPSTDSISVGFIDSPDIDFSVNDVVCFGDGNGIITTEVTDGNLDLIYSWGNGSDTTILTNLEPGDYPITITNNVGCAIERVITVGTNTPVEYETMIRDVLCFNDGDGQISLELTGGGIPPFLFGMAGAPLTETTYIDGLSGGIYNIIIEDANGCMILDTIDIYEPEEVLVEAGPDQLLELGESTIINGQVSNTSNQSIFWSPNDSIDCNGCLRTSVNPVFTTTYTLTAIDSISGCTRQDSLKIYLQKSRNIFIPNAFSPNTDGFNDQFNFFSDQSVSSIRYLRIFTRWGEMVYEAENFLPNDTRFSWDGKHRDKPLNPQVLVYIAEVEFIDGVIKEYKGDLTLIR